MGTAGIIGGALVVLLAVGAGVVRLRRRAASALRASAVAPPTGWRLTSDAVGELVSPPWRVVHQLPDGVFDDIDHVVVGPPGVVAIRTRLSPMPAASGPAPTDAAALAASAVARSGIDDALAEVGLSSDVLVHLHWGRNDHADAAVELGRDHVAVDGRRLAEWLDALEPRLTPTLVDHAWRTIVTAAGRPDPLADR